MNNTAQIILHQLLQDAFRTNPSMYDATKITHNFTSLNPKNNPNVDDVMFFQTFKYVQHNGLKLDFDIYVGTHNYNKQCLSSLKLVPKLKLMTGATNVTVPKNNGGFEIIYACETNIADSLEVASQALDDQIALNPYFQP